MKEIKKGSTVLYLEGWYRVTACFKNKVNLGEMFGNRVLIKNVPKSEVKEDHENWYESWTQSETYQSM